MKLNKLFTIIKHNLPDLQKLKIILIKSQINRYLDNTFQ